MPAHPEAAEVALLSRALDHALTYRIPEDLHGAVAAGSIVVVPLQDRWTSGVVVRLTDPPPNTPLKPIRSLLDEQPALFPAQLALARWISAEYAAPLGRCCALMVPPGFTPKSAFVYAIAGHATVDPADANSKRILDALGRRGPLTEQRLGALLVGARGWRPALRRLVEGGMLTRTSILEPPKVAPSRVTLAQLIVSPATLEIVLTALAEVPARKQAAASRRAKALRYVAGRNGIAWADYMLAETGATRADLAWLAEQSYILLGDAQRWRDPLADVDYVAREAPSLTSDQARAWEAVREAMDREGGGGAFLIRGVTGSGKTEIYMRAVDRALARGQGALILVPEISLTPQTARRFLERFPGKVALIHSRLRPGERLDTWRRIRSGELPVVVGARSALFSPLARPGLIVLDEEHDASYKQSNVPYYDARRVAMRYADATGATLMLGSATPSLDSWQLAKPIGLDRPRLALLELPNRVRGHVNRIADQQARFGITAAAVPETDTVAYQPLPDVQLIDMRAEMRGGNSSIFSGSLRIALGETFRRGEQAILFLNRRGSASCVLCRDCGHVVKCPNDDTPLTLHMSASGSDPDKAAPTPGGRLKCHVCDRTEAPPARCPACGGRRVRYIGLGTQRVEQSLREEFPAARVVRWDRDTASGRTTSDNLLQRFVNRQADALVGTQMIAKGLDLPMVTLVGVVLADVGLFLPDFRASERVFGLIEQVAGRAGRGLLPGRVIVQSYNPEHPAIAFAAAHDVDGFTRYELAQRRAARLPPFTRLIRVEINDADDARARLRAEMVARLLRRACATPEDVMGPAPAYFGRRNRLFRWQVIARTQSPRDVLAGLDLPPDAIVDVDPISVL
ncbi:MAG: primosomal protein N' [Anaerolineae bacterium]|nr:primosomal protein N' [Anaerolineae bacterium]